jgi:hypothetical protein
VRVGDAELERASHRCERYLRQPFLPQVCCHAPRLPRDLGTVAAVQRKRHEAETGMADACVEIDVEPRRERVGPRLWKQTRHQPRSNTGIGDP